MISAVRILFCLTCFLGFSCTKNSKPVDLSGIVKTTWVDSAYQHPALNFFIAHNMESPAYVNLKSPDSTIQVLLIRGKIPYQSGYSIWSVLFYPSKNVKIMQESLVVDTFGQIQDTLELELSENTDVTRPLIIQSDTTGPILNYRWLSFKVAGNAIAASFDSARTVSIESLTGLSGSLADYRGKIVVINWWASWCKPCVAEIPGLNRLVEQYAELDVVFIAVSPEPVDKLIKFFKTRPFKYQQMTTDSSGSVTFGNAFPRHLILDTTGRLVWENTGGNPDMYQTLDQQLQNLMAQKGKEEVAS